MIVVGSLETRVTRRTRRRHQGHEDEEVSEPKAFLRDLLRALRILLFGLPALRRHRLVRGGTIALARIRPVASATAIMIARKPVSIPESRSWLTSAERLRMPIEPGTSRIRPGRCMMEPGRRDQRACRLPAIPTISAPMNAASTGEPSGPPKLLAVHASRQASTIHGQSLHAAWNRTTNPSAAVARPIGTSHAGRAEPGTSGTGPVNCCATQLPSARPTVSNAKTTMVEASRAAPDT